MSDGLLDGLPDEVRVIEVGPRDGLQNQPRTLPVSQKVEWIRRLAACGIREIEATSFVNPRWVPQLADARDLMLLLDQDPGLDNGATVFSTLVPNLHGLEDAFACGVRHVALFTAASETFNRKNLNCSIHESLARFERIFASIGDACVRVRGYISTCFGCPYEGQVPAEKVVEVARRLRDLGATEIALSDTTGVATPPSIERVVEAVAATIPISELALHLHDTRGLALANVLVGLRLGVSTFDASSGGLGGCPYAPGASGNLATEDLLTLLHSLDIETGIDLAALIETNLWFETHFPTPFPGRVLASRRG